MNKIEELKKIRKEIDLRIKEIQLIESKQLKLQQSTIFEISIIDKPQLQSQSLKDIINAERFDNKPFSIYNNIGVPLESFKTFKEAKNDTGYSTSVIRRCLFKNHTTKAGFTFKFDN